jgi:hypothetical protein
MANVLLSVVRKLGIDVDRIGDSTGEVAIWVANLGQGCG